MAMTAVICFSTDAFAFLTAVIWTTEAPIPQPTTRAIPATMVVLRFFMRSNDPKLSDCGGAA
jgi:hypothetical protein